MNGPPDALPSRAAPSGRPSPYPEIVELDNREEESLSVEARKQPEGGGKKKQRRAQGPPLPSF